jgi:hypothetical protein
MPRSILNRLRGRDEWCCFGLRAAYENARERGFAIIVGLCPDGEPRFLMQCCSGHEGPLPKTDMPPSVVTQAVVSHCPWCGVNLGKRYGERAGELFREGLEITY